MMREEERFRKANPVGITRILSTLVENMGIGTDIFLKKIKDNWKDIVGATNARNMKPVSLKDGILTIAVSSPAWNTQARFYKNTILRNIEQFEPDSAVEITYIRFVLERY